MKPSLRERRQVRAHHERDKFWFEVTEVPEQILFRSFSQTAAGDELAARQSETENPSGAFQGPAPTRVTLSLLKLVQSDLCAKAEWCYQSTHSRAILKTLLTDGTVAMLCYRLMQWARRWKLVPLEMFFNKWNVLFCNCIIGRGAEFGRGFVLVHSTGVVINGRVRGGEHVYIEHQVTIGAERRQSPLLGDHVFIGAGAKVVGSVTIGSHCRIGANAVVISDVPDGATAVGIPARVVNHKLVSD
jgi:serine O-acetyltransferase